MQMKRLALVLLLASGCKKEDPLFCEMNPGKDGCPGEQIDGGVTDDGDNTDSGPDARACFGTDFEVCFDGAPPPTAIVFTAADFDTGTSPMCITPTPADWLANQPDACIVAGSSLALANPLAVTGTRPLVIVSTTTIVINASIDAAGHVNGKRGPGGPSALCPAYTTAPAGNANGGAGGAGGSFITQGGGGGTGNNNLALPGNPTAVAAASATLRGGCDGQDGGIGNGGAGSEGRGGFAGGAILLVADSSITIGSGVTINASGAGARKPPTKQAGGGGGGAGGMIALDAAAITATGAFLMANGGGGSSGSEDTGSGNATDGGDPIAGMPTIRALGGVGPDNAGSGGTGWVEGDAQGGGATNGQSGRGGGGGGGGGGYIRVSTASGATSSPTEDVVP